MLQHIQSENYTVEIGSILESSFSNLLENKYKNSRKIILVDENTHDCCLEFMIQYFPSLAEAEVILLPVGEENKVMEVCFQVWEAFSEYAFDRKDLVLNLGGGVVCDMGGFIASIYKRGLDFIHIPTSLLAMVDASVGGKTGIDLGSYKNQLGLFSNPKAVFIDAFFLETLPEEEFVSGFAEMLKHGLISEAAQWNELKTLNPIEKKISEDAIFNSISVKNEIVLLDPTEKGERKKLNFGHTIGHALEGFFLSFSPIKHGHAVALGMLGEAFISKQKGLLASESFFEIEHFLTLHFELIELDESYFEQLFSILLNDKKNENGKILMTLLEGIGKSKINVETSLDEVKEAFNYLAGLWKLSR